MAQPPREVAEEPAAFDAEDIEFRRVMADMDAGRFVSHEAVVRWLKSWGTENELPPPKCGD